MSFTIWMISCILILLKFVCGIVASIGHRNYFQISRHNTTRDERWCIKSHICIVVWHMKMSRSLFTRGQWLLCVSYWWPNKDFWVLILYMEPFHGFHGLIYPISPLSPISLNQQQSNMFVVWFFCFFWGGGVGGVRLLQIILFGHINKSSFAETLHQWFYKTHMVPRPQTETP